MSLEQLADTMKGRPELDVHAKEHAAERAREPFHNAWLREVYAPFWQAPLKQLSRATGVSRVGHGVDIAPDVGVSFATLPLVLGEDIFIETVVGVAVLISYVFAGDVNDGQLIRLPRIVDGGKRSTRNDLAKVWTGPIDRLMTAAEQDVEEVSGMLPMLLVEGVKAHDDRLTVEAKAVAEAEAAQLAEDEKRRKDEDARQEQLRTAALEASKKAEEAAKEAPPEVRDETPPVARRRGK